MRMNVHSIVEKGWDCQDGGAETWLTGALGAFLLMARARTPKRANEWAI
jgi:hypothetical protein